MLSDNQIENLTSERWPLDAFKQALPDTTDTELYQLTVSWMKQEPVFENHDPKTDRTKALYEEAKRRGKTDIYDRAYHATH